MENGKDNGESIRHKIKTLENLFNNEEELKEER